MQCSLYDIVFEGPSDEWSSTESAGHRLAEEIYLWAGDNRDGIWVFQGGHWNKNRELRNAIQQASWQDIFLDKEFLTNLRRDVRSFFDNQKIYDNLGTSWKRGILLVGPPGNGKTETIKVLLKEAKQNALYVKSFTSADGVSFFIFHLPVVNAEVLIGIERTWSQSNFWFCSIKCALHTRYRGFRLTRHWRSPVILLEWAWRSCGSCLMLLSLSVLIPVGAKRRDLNNCDHQPSRTNWRCHSESSISFWR